MKLHFVPVKNCYEMHILIGIILHINRVKYNKLLSELYNRINTPVSKVKG
jgi:hypothetical protein